MAKKWVHPTEDEICMQDQVQFQDPRDPRALGAGPFGDLHCKLLTVEETKERREWYYFHGNRFGRWLDCEVCNLRLAYWPKLGAAGCNVAVPAPVVTMALESLKEQGHWEICDKDLMREHIKQAASVQKAEGSITRDALLSKQQEAAEKEKKERQEAKQAARRAAQEMAASFRRNRGAGGVGSVSAAAGPAPKTEPAKEEVKTETAESDSSRPKLRVRRTLPPGPSGSNWPQPLPTPPSGSSSPDSGLMVTATDVKILEDDFDEDPEVNMTAREMQEQIQELQRKNKLLTRKMAEAEISLPPPPPPPPTLAPKEEPGKK